MTNKQEEILKMEEEARSLVDNLSVLYEQVGSYQTAQDELKKTNVNLTAFIQETKELAQESHKIIEITNKIGSGEIFKKLSEVEKQINLQSSTIANGISKQTELQGNTAKIIENKMNEIGKSGKRNLIIMVIGFVLMLILQFVLLIF